MESSPPPLLFGITMGRAVDEVDAVVDNLVATVSSLAEVGTILAAASAAGGMDVDGGQELELEQEQEQQVKSLVTAASIGLVGLRGAARRAYLDEDACRQQVAGFKKDMDTYHLHHQNLLYEHNHLLREIKLCQDLAMREVEKIKEDEEDPDLLAGASQLQSAEEHQANLDRLQEELRLRADMQSQLKELKELVEKGGREVEERKQWLEGLPDCLKELEKATEPLQKYTNFAFGGRREQQRRAAALPLPLHTLFCQLEAYCDIKGEERGFTIAVKPASQYRSSQILSTCTLGGAESLFVSPMAEKLATKRRKRHHPSALQKEVADDETQVKSVPPEDLLNDLIASHDEAVELQLHPAPNVQALIRFQYMEELQLVVAEASSPHLLTNLFPSDTGERTPNLANCHMAGVSGDFVFPSDIAGRPYRWVQWLAGLSFSCPGNRPLEPTTAAVVERIRSRVLSAEALSAQLSCLSSKRLPSPHADVAPLLAPTSRVKVDCWEELPQADSPPSESSWEVFGSRTFKLCLTFGQKVWDGTVIVSAEYPLRPPKFISSRSATSSGFDADLHAVDAEVNGHCHELLTEDVSSWDQLLAHQVLRCAGCLVAWDRGGGETTGRSRRGRSRRLQVMFDREAHAYMHR
jgi:hypothetical protein